MRNRAWRRHKNYTKAKRKQRIVHEQNDYWHYPYFGQYIKGKIHCSCPMCAYKTRNKGKHRNRQLWHGPIYYKHSELKRQIAMTEEENEFKNLTF